jgi:DNA topoisomerase IA
LPAEPLPTEAGLSLFGVLKQADPALVDPGVTAQLECLLDDVVVGKQEMVGAIDIVCSVFLTQSGVKTSVGTPVALVS